MSARAFRAPAKLVVTGEYAVLEQAPALVMAIDRYVRVRIEASETWVVASDLEGQAEERFSVSFPESRLTSFGEMGIQQHGQHRGMLSPGSCMVASAIMELHTHASRMSPRPARVTLASADLRARGSAMPLGLGSSAALCTCVARAIEAWCGAPDRTIDPYTLHSDWQGDAGSGIDVAAAVHGGLLEFVRAPTPAVTQARAAPRVATRALPPGLVFGVYFTGTSASTPEFLKTMGAFAKAKPTAYAEAIARIRSASEAACHAVSNKDTAAFLKAIGAHEAAQSALGEASGLAIVTPPHRALAEAARACGAVYKPSGAGGGDVGLAFTSSETALDQLTAAVEGMGLRRVTAALDPEGCTETPLEEGPSA